jgi:hypothetical protein
MSRREKPRISYSCPVPYLVNVVPRHFHFCAGSCEGPRNIELPITPCNVSDLLVSTVRHISRGFLYSYCGEPKLTAQRKGISSDIRFGNIMNHILATPFFPYFVKSLEVLVSTSRAWMYFDKARISICDCHVCVPFALHTS